MRPYVEGFSLLREFGFEIRNTGGVQSTSKERLAKITSELEELSSKRDAMKLQWQTEKQRIDENRKLKEELEQLKIEETKYTR